MNDTITQVKAAILDWLLANCIEEDEGGWMRLCFSTSRQLSEHTDWPHWMLSDIAAEAGIDLDAAPAQQVLVADLSMMVRKLVLSIRRLAEDGSKDLTFANTCMDWLKTKGLAGSPLRDGPLEAKLVNQPPHFPETVQALDRLNSIEQMQGGATGLTIQLRADIERMNAAWNDDHAKTMSQVQPAQPDPQLCKFYNVETFPDLVEAQARHIEKLQAKLPITTEETVTQRVREG